MQVTNINRFKNTFFWMNKGEEREIGIEVKVRCTR